MSSAHAGNFDLSRYFHVVSMRQLQIVSAQNSDGTYRHRIRIKIRKEDLALNLSAAVHPEVELLTDDFAISLGAPLEQCQFKSVGSRSLLLCK